MHNPDFLLCKAFDNRVGMALTIQILQTLESMHHPNTVVGVGTVQEELGMRGAETAVHCVKPDAAIVFEGSPADDLPGTPEEERQGAVGRGVQVRVMDPSAIMSREFTRYAIETAELYGIAHQVAVRKAGATDARPIQLHAAGVPTIVLGVPSRYIHTHNGIMNLGDYMSALDLALKLVANLDEATVASFTAFHD
jgi:endoglucanase